MASDSGPREVARDRVRDALAQLEQVPAAGLDAGKHETLSDVVDDVRSLEQQLTNEVDQQREGNDDE